MTSALSETSMPAAGRATGIPKNMFQDTKCFCFNFTAWEEAN